MRVASILCKNISVAQTQIKAALPFCDVIELRLDYLHSISIPEIQLLRNVIALPVIFTLRTKAQGGQCTLPDPERFQTLENLAALSPDYLDLEFDTPAEFILPLQKKYPAIQIIGSYHDFKQTPADLMLLFQNIYKSHFPIFKIATFAHNLCDTLRLLIFLQIQSRTHRIIGMAMGEYGQSSRILSPIVGSLMTYGSVDTESAAAPGQLTLQEMTDIYRVQQLNANTAIYALLGDPVTQSPGHLFHNQKFSEENKNAVYVKLKLSPMLLEEACALFKQLPFAGFSVTIPHKETICAYLDEVGEDTKTMGAVNTIQVKKEKYCNSPPSVVVPLKVGIHPYDGSQSVAAGGVIKYIGSNTDGIAAIDVLEEKTTLPNKKILILGAGGSAKAIAYMLIKRGAVTTLCNRTLQRAEQIAQNFSCDAMDFDVLFHLKKLSYDVIINTLPSEAFAEQCATWQIPSVSDNPIAMDIVLKPLDTLFLQHALAAGYICIAGNALYKAQALRQLGIWFE